MREHRWETQTTISFEEILSLAHKLQKAGLTTIHSQKEVIGYIEEWEVESVEQIQSLSSWATEDVTLLHVFDAWQGDFFLLAGRYHSIFQRHQNVNTYCSIAHPWRIPFPLATLQPEAWLWVGFRHTHGFIRVRVQTTEVIAPGETVDPAKEEFWMHDREQAFQTAVEILDLPIETHREPGKISLNTSRTDTPLFCSWPDAIGPCQFELNSPDPFEFLVPASQLASTFNNVPAPIRVYLTGFSQEALTTFQVTDLAKRYMYRCSIHCLLSEMPELLGIIAPHGRLYGSLAEFQSAVLLSSEIDAATIVGVVGTNGEFRVEIRLNQLPLPASQTQDWLENLIDKKLCYVPLPPFP